ncbi:MAG: TIGR04222 domain-containing membrane protein [Bacteroidales bacterium]|nr:TIGR04222 domain-containing membrane protein [Bacteroidales bacterium]
MLEFIKEIPGPYFLIIYSIVSVIVIILAKKYAENDYTKNLEIPEPTKFTPLDIALLRKGIKGTVIVSIFNLWRNKKIDIKKEKGNIALKQLSSDCNGLNKLESVILKNTQTQKLYNHFFTPSSIKTIQKILQPNMENLEMNRLISDSKVKKRYWNAAIFSLVILLLFGGTKLFLGLSRGKPVVFLVILIVLSVISIFYFIKPQNVKFSALGRKFLNHASKRFEWLKSNENNALLMDDNLLYGIALFGISSFIGSTLERSLENPALLETYAGSYNGFGCGGTGCGGSGCSGGSGCGGCGGGD